MAAFSPSLIRHGGGAAGGGDGGRDGGAGGGADGGLGGDGGGGEGAWMGKMATAGVEALCTDTPRAVERADVEVELSVLATLLASASVGRTICTSTETLAGERTYRDSGTRQRGERVGGA